ncbi:restriction endonuclease subunit S, partial [bacterium]|nr:restriction endonuclease subunit S [bacterium]
SEEFNQHWDFIAEHFDLLFQTPEHVAPLRQSILELAVRGKLTRRDAGDESAGELLKRISEEKAQNKKKETIAPIKDDEKPFDLPVAWEWARLKQIMIDLQTGPFGSNLHKSDYVSNGIPIVNPVNMRDGKIVPLSQMMISEKTRERLSQYILEEGDLVLARRGEIG